MAPLQQKGEGNKGYCGAQRTKSNLAPLQQMWMGVGVCVCGCGTKGYFMGSYVIEDFGTAGGALQWWHPIY